MFASAPPDVWNPSAHVAQVAAPTAENFLSLPHVVLVLVPSQLYPALHRSQDVRLMEVQAPVPAAQDVYDPALQVEHAVAPSLLWRLSLPHEVHALLAPPLNDPAVQRLMALLPPQDDPAQRSGEKRRGGGDDSVCVS